VEKIRKALDLARAERSRLASEPAAMRVAEPPDASIAGAPAAVVDLDALRVAPGTAPADSSEPRRTSSARSFQPDGSVLERSRVLAQHSTSPAAEAFRLLRTQVLHRMAEHGWRSLAVLSPNADHTRSTVSINLAAAIAADPRYHALLVELDLRSPRVAGMFGFAPEFGVERALAGEVGVERCLYRPNGYARLTLLPAGAPLARASELLAAPHTRAFAAELHGRYPDRVIVYDVAPVLLSDEALTFLPAVDCGLVVVTEARTRRDDLTQAMRLLSRIPLVGTVLGDAAGAGRSRE
jgi:Mrp family chromosome partitioning ATPase